MSETELECLDQVATSVFVLDVSEDAIPIYSHINAYAQSQGAMTADEVIGKTALQVFSGRGGVAVYERHLDCIETGEPQNYELRLPLNAGNRLIRTTINPVKNRDGKVIRLVGTSLDITDQEQDREAKVNVQTITHEMEDFITMAAHDLRTPMRNVHHIADMLRDDFEDLGDGKLQLIDLLEDVAVKATALISDVLSHAQATKAIQDLVTFDFTDLCRELCDVLDPMGTHQVSLPDAHIIGDKTAYQIVVRNLLDNAFKHGGRKALQMSIKTRPVGNDMIEVTVRDNGQGFENPGVAFLESGKLRTDSGFGLLGIRRLVRSRGGDICAQTPEVGRGSVIIFTLPGKFCIQKAGLEHPVAASAS